MREYIFIQLWVYLIKHKLHIVCFLRQPARKTAFVMQLFVLACVCELVQRWRTAERPTNFHAASDTTTPWGRDSLNTRNYQMISILTAGGPPASFLLICHAIYLIMENTRAMKLVLLYFVV